MSDEALPITIFTLDPNEAPQPFVFRAHSNVVSQQIVCCARGSRKALG
jgi:hypothetical protein